MSDATATSRLISGERWAIAPDVDALGDGMFRRVRQPLGLTAFGMNVKVMQPGTSSRMHWHTEQQEVIFVHEGAVEVRFGDGSTHRVGEGGIIRIDPGEPHEVRVVSPRAAVIVMMGGKDGIVEGDAMFAEQSED